MRKLFLLLAAVIVIMALATSWIIRPSGPGKANDESPAKVTWSESGITLSPDQVKERSVEAARKVVAEGVVLLKNENNTLPLKPKNGSYRVNVFGASSLDPEFAGGGGADITVPCMGFYEGLSKAGIEYNMELYQAYNEWYEKFKTESPYAGGIVGDEGSSIWDLSDAGALNAEWNIATDTYNSDGSVRVPKMDGAILERTRSFSDAAIVFLTRKGSEGNDLKVSELTLVEPEAALLSWVTANFSDVIVVFNTCNLMSMGWLDGQGNDQDISFSAYRYGIDSGKRRRSFMGESIIYDYVTVKYDTPHTYHIGDINSAMIIWSPGAEGMLSVAEILKGSINPSGRLIDAVAHDLSTNPAYENYGNYTYEDDSKVTYVTYEEGIYVGYQYYETFAPDKVLYSLGHGLSYSDFGWDVTGYRLGNNKYGETTVEVSVRVTNKGPMPGKDVVELYYSQPFYNDGRYGVEKSLINLGAFKKTSLLNAGQSEEVTLVLNVRDMASWSSIAGCYVLEGGKYSIEVATDASDARKLYFKPDDRVITLNVASGLKADLKLKNGKLSNPYADPGCIKYDQVVYGGEKMYSVRYTSDEVTGTLYRNWFDDCSGRAEVNAVYMARQDVDGIPSVKSGTYPKSPEKDEYVTSVIKNNNKFSSYSELTYWANDLNDLRKVVGEQNFEKLASPVLQGVVYRDDSGKPDLYSIQEMFADIGSGKNEDACWNRFLDQLSFYEMLHINDGCGFQFPPLEQYGVYWSWGNDGAAQVGPLRISMGRKNPARVPDYKVTGFPSGTCLCATWNPEVAYEMGFAQGYEAYFLGHSALYAPGLNLHRTQSGGRNFEYMSEDTYLGGTIIAQLCRGMQDPGGLCAGVKHFMLNDQEVNRRGVHTYLSEQALRETYGESWEICFKEGGAMGIMGAFNCIGYNWVGNSFALNTALLRNEWGYKGYIVSDLGAIRNPQGGYYSWVSCIISGEDSLEETINWNREYVKDAIGYYERGEPYASIILNSIRANTRHIFNAWSRSNGYIEDVNAAMAKYKAGGYDFDPTTPDEHGYTDIGWYGLVTIGQGRISDGNTVLPVRISGNNGLSAATFEVRSAVSLAAITDAYGKELQYTASSDPESGLKLYTVAFKDPEVRIADRDLFRLVLDENNSAIAEDYKLSLGYTDAADRIGHQTKLYVGERPVPAPADSRRPF
jgi:beta-glucosidase